MGRMWLQKLLLTAAVLSMIFVVSLETSHACTRVVFHGEGEQIITARSMDWKSDLATNLWVFPSGMSRNGEAGPNSVEWTSKYGSVIASAYDAATTDGVNEKGLVANVLWLVESTYPTPNADTPMLSLAAWAQYVLDNFATVEETVEALAAEPFIVVTANVPGESRLASLHLAVSDAEGDSAIFEYIDGKLVIHHNRDYRVMTNSPPFDEQLALNAYWENIGGTVMLPGTNRAADRFVRAMFYSEAIPKNQSDTRALASMFGVIRNASVPYGLTTESEPNISSTRWRTVTDHRNLLYFFESALSPNIFWVDLKKLNLGPRGRVMRLDLGPEQTNIYAGEVSRHFKRTTPFTFLGL